MRNNNALLKADEALGAEQIIKDTALLYLQDALVTQRFETCRELIDTAKSLGVTQGDITAVITDYLNTGGASRRGRNRYL